MKKWLKIIIFIGFGYNCFGFLVNPGFDLTPWDSGWSISIDTCGRFHSGGVKGEIRPDTGVSLLNCCYLRTSVSVSCPGGHSACWGWGKQKL